MTVGGMIAECKRIRTKKGDPMMFATLDDLEGQVEMLVFNSAYAANEDKLDVDKLVIVRGRVDHKEQGETKLVVQDVEAFEPTAEEIEEAREAAANAPPPPSRRLTLSVDGAIPATFLEDLQRAGLPPPRRPRARAPRRSAAAAAGRGLPRVAVALQGRPGRRCRASRQLVG